MILFKWRNIWGWNRSSFPSICWW